MSRKYSAFIKGLPIVRVRTKKPMPDSPTLESKLRALVVEWREQEKQIKRMYAHPQDYSDTKQEGRGEAICDCADELEALLAMPVEWRSVLENLLNACLLADAHGELSEYVDGSLLDAAKEALRSPSTTANDLSKATNECDICGRDTPHYHDKEMVELERFVRPAFEKTTVPRNAFGRIAKNPDCPYSDKERRNERISQDRNVVRAGLGDLQGQSRSV